MAAVRNAAGCLLSSELLGAPSATKDLQWDVADARVFDESGRIHHVMVAGRVVVEDGLLVTGDLDTIREDGDREARKLWQRMEDM